MVEYQVAILRSRYPTRIFQGQKYQFNRKMNRYLGSKGLLSHAIWNHHNPEDPVLKGEDVHHKNESSIDDRIENYEKISHGPHSKIHKIGKKRAPFTAETRKKMSLGHQGLRLSEEHRRNISLGLKGKSKGFLGKNHSEETKAKIRISNIGQKRSEEAKRNMREGKRLAKERKEAAK